MRRTSGDIEVDPKNTVRTIESFRMTKEGAAGNRACAYSYYDFGRRYGFIGLFESQSHILSYGTSDQQPVSVARRRYKLNPESSEVKHYRVKDINVRLTSVTSAGADLSQLERSTEDAMGFFGEPSGKP